MEKDVKVKKYKEAFKCNKCHEGMDCPCYVSLLFKNERTQEHKVVEGCIFQLLPILLIETIKVADIHTSAIYQHRNDLLKQLSGVACQMIKTAQLYKQSVQTYKEVYLKLQENLEKLPGYKK